MNDVAMVKYRPFLKWAGNKYQILDRIRVLLPRGNCLIEPFVGSGAVFLNTNYEEYVLADNNEGLINLFLTLQYEREPFIEYCRSFFTGETNSADQYYKLREEFNTTSNSKLKAGLFLYLNRHSYNGLCRYNSKGGFNVPFGQYSKPCFPEKEMRHFISMAGRPIFKVADFRDTMRSARRGDVIYCDPPYVPLSATSNFTSYSAGGFGMSAQIELAELAEELSLRGVPVLISNHATEFTLNAYKSARIEQFDVQRFISCKGDNRGKAGEVLALFDREWSPER
jgi:DNA adenine methylase